MPKRSCLKSRPSEKCQGFNERTGCLIVNIETFGIRLVSSYCILHSISGDFSVVWDTITENVDTWTHAKTFVMIWRCIVATYVSKCSPSVGFAATLSTVQSFYNSEL